MLQVLRDAACRFNFSVANYTDTLPQGNGFCEIAGGIAHTTRILVKHAVPGGPNFDLVCGCDLTKHDEQQVFWQTNIVRDLRVVIM
jgi:hypothetical protein